MSQAAAPAIMASDRGFLRADLVSSLVLHIAIILLVAFWAPRVPPSMLQDTSLPIDIITIDEFTQLQEKATPQDKSKDQALSKVAPRPEVREVAPPAPDASAAMPTLSEKAPDTAAIDTPAKPAPVFKVRRAAPVARPSFREPKPAPLLDVGRVQALLDKTPDAVPISDDTLVLEENAEIGEKLTLNEIDAFRLQMRQCWSPPAGARRAEDLRVNVRLSLSPSGAILAGPVVVNRGQLGDPFFRAAAESVLRAIRRCQPFTMPVEKYASWRDIELIFDPRKMLGN